MAGSVEPPVDGGFGQEEQGEVEGDERGRGERGQGAEDGEGGFSAPIGEDGNRRHESEQAGEQESGQRVVGYRPRNDVRKGGEKWSHWRGVPVRGWV